MTDAVLLARDSNSSELYQEGVQEIARRYDDYRRLLRSKHKTEAEEKDCAAFDAMGHECWRKFGSAIGHDVLTAMRESDNASEAGTEKIDNTFCNYII